MGVFHSFYLEEPDLIFGGQGEDKDPRIGLNQYGPYYSSKESAPSPSEIRIGIIGSGETIGLAKQLLSVVKNKIPSDEPNHWLYPDFPGFSLATQVKSEMVNTDRWNSTITQGEIEKILGVRDTNQRIAAASQLYFDKMKAISLEEDHPLVILCTLPSSIEDYCGISPKTRGAKVPKFTPLEKTLSKLREQNQRFLTEWGIDLDEQHHMDSEKDYDFHNSLKGKAMAVGIPIQVIRESSLNAFLNYPTSKTGQNRATFAWNLMMGLYYKANGRPWRLAKLVPGTCYVGISFYKNLRNPDLNIESSMAQLFTHSGEGFVLRGTDVTIDERTKEPHLTEKQSEELLRDVLEKYELKVRTKPSRIVVHKTSEFTEAESKGLRKAIGESAYDFVAIRRSSKYRFLREGNYPVLRGTVIELTPREYLLFTGGYIPRLRTYPGHRVPEPLHIVHQGDSDSEIVCREILGLTKLNWNTTSFSTNRPITLEFATKVGGILSELPVSHAAQDHYRFYM